MTGLGFLRPPAAAVPPLTPNANDNNGNDVRGGSIFVFEKVSSWWWWSQVLFAHFFAILSFSSPS